MSKTESPSIVLEEDNITVLSTASTTPQQQQQQHQQKPRTSMRRSFSLMCRRMISMRNNNINGSNHQSRLQSNPLSPVNKNSDSGFWETFCFRDRCIPIDKSTVFFLQALFVWVMLCLPGNIVTGVLYHRVMKHLAFKEFQELALQEGGDYYGPSSLCALLGNATDLGLHLDLGEECDGICQHSHNSSWLSKSCFSSMLRQGPIRSYIQTLGCQRSNSTMEICIRNFFSDFYEDARDEEEDDDEQQQQQQQEQQQQLEPEEVPIQFNSSSWQHVLNYSLGLESNSSGGNNYSVEYQCHEGFEEARHLMTHAQFWLEGVLLLIIGVFGIFGNVMTLIVLRRIDSNATFSFNRLLMSLAIVDTLLLLYYVLDYGIVGVFMRSVGSPEPYWYRISFPYLLHPFKGFCISASIFMVVAISAERHRAICSPLTHRPTFWPYAAMVFCISGTINIPRFFEFELKTMGNITDYWTTPLNEDQDYITFSSWWDELIVTGVIPLFSLVAFNLRIYLKLRASDHRGQEYRFVGRRQQNHHHHHHHHHSGGPGGGQVSRSNTVLLNHQSGAGPATNPVNSCTTSPSCSPAPFPGNNKDVKRMPSNEKQVVRATVSLGSHLQLPSQQQPQQQQQHQVSPSAKCRQTLSIPGIRKSRPMSCHGFYRQQQQQQQQQLEMRVFKERNRSSSVKNGRHLNQASEELPLEEIKRIGEEPQILFRSSKKRINNHQQQQQPLTHQQSSSPPTISSPIATQQQQQQQQLAINPVPSPNDTMSRRTMSGYNGHTTGSSTTQHFRKRREKSALVLVSIVLTFLACHTFRLTIQAYEVTHPSHSTAEHHEFCLQRGRFHVPVAFYVMLSASHLLLVVNSSINFLIYCCVGRSFRTELKTIVKSVCGAFCSACRR